MDTNLLIVFGIILIFISLVFILRFSKKEKEIHKDILLKYNDIKDYTDIMEEIVENMDSLIDTVLEKYNQIEERLDNISSDTAVTQDSSIEKLIGVDEIVDDHIEEELLPRQDNDVHADEHCEVIEGRKEKRTLKDEIRELREAGLTNSEIAKKLNKGVREIDIISKMLKIKGDNNFN